MAENSKIEWTDHTWNGWWGCTHVHAGCTNCYAEAMAKRVGKGWGPSAPRYMTGPQVWNAPLKWNAAAEKAGVRARVFASSMCDIFEDSDRQVCDWKKRPLFVVDPGRYQIQGEINEYPYKLPPLTIADLRRDMFRLIDQTPWLDWQLLTKRPENIRRMWPAQVQPSENWFFDAEEQKRRGLTHAGPHKSTVTLGNYPRKNVWLGTSVSDQKTADAMIPHLYECHDLAPVRFLSIEPLLGPVNLLADPRWFWAGSGLKWVIVGGESGHGARPCGLHWIRSIRDQCAAANVPCFIKQIGANPVFSDEYRDDVKTTRPGSKVVTTLDPKGGDMNEWPDDLRIRQFPQPTK